MDIRKKNINDREKEGRVCYTLRLVVSKWV